MLPSDDELDARMEKFGDAVPDGEMEVIVGIHMGYLKGAAKMLGLTLTEDELRVIGEFNHEALTKTVSLVARQQVLRTLVGMEHVKHKYGELTMDKLKTLETKAHIELIGKLEQNKGLKLDKLKLPELGGKNEKEFDA